MISAVLYWVTITGVVLYLLVRLTRHSRLHEEGDLECGHCYVIWSDGESSYIMPCTLNDEESANETAH